jgi:hypothetical protein
VTFGPSPSAWKITGIHAKGDTNLAAVAIYARTSTTRRYAPTETPTNGQTVIAVANLAYTTDLNKMSNADHVVYAHADGTLLKTTLSAASTGTVTLATALTKAGAAGDAIYEIKQAFQIEVGTTALNQYGGHVFAVPWDSPCYVLLSSGTNATLGVTSDR